MKPKVPPPLFIRRVKRFLTLFITCIAFLLLLTSEIKQGDLTPAKPEAKLLKVKMPKEKAGMSFEYQVSKKGIAGMSSDHLVSTGGIAFFQVAQPQDNITVQSLDIAYQPQQSDGQRLKLIINGMEINCDLPDWLLVPIAQYTNSSFNSCITLSGNLADISLEQAIKKGGGLVLNYHPAFSNTILGWYLKQTDLLLLHLHAIKTPELNSTDNHSYIEFNIPVAQKESAFQDTQDMLAELQASMRGKHRSWLISDYAEDIRFDIYGNDLSIEADVSFNCWRFLSDAPSMIEENNRERMNLMKSILQHEFDTDIEFYNKGHYTEDAYRTKLFKRLAKSLPSMLELHYNIAKVNFTESELIKIMSAYSSDNLPTLLNSFNTQKLVDLWNVSTIINCLYHIVPLEEYSQSISENNRLIRAVNPDAWDATMSAIKYSAFFQYVKQNFPQQWKEFMDSVNNVGVEDLIETPTALYPSDNFRLKQLLN